MLTRLGVRPDAIQTLLLPIAAVTATAVLSRFIWIFGSDLVRRLARCILPKNVPAPSFSVAAVMSWAGMRGVVSLAAALSLPEGLPGRDFVLAATFFGHPHNGVGAGEHSGASNQAAPDHERRGVAPRPGE